MSRKTSTFKTFTMDGESYEFSVEAFRNQFIKAKEKKKKETGKRYTAENLYADISAAMLVSDEAVRKWYKGDNGPVDIEKIKDLADFFGIEPMDLLQRKEVKIMSKEAILISREERDVVLNVFHQITDLIWFEAYHFKGVEFGTKYQERRAYLEKSEELRQDIYKYVDQNSLLITKETKIKLYNILAELGTSTAEIEAATGRWLRLNDNYYLARIYFEDGGFAESEEEKIDELQREIGGSIERAYCVDCNEIIFEGFHKETTAKEAAAVINRSPLCHIKENEVELKPYSEDQFLFPYSPADIYKFEFMKLMTLIFREDFPQYFSEEGMING